MANQFSVPTRQLSNSSIQSHQSLPHPHPHSSRHHHLHHHHHHHPHHHSSSHSHGPAGFSKPIPMEASASASGIPRESVSVDRSRGGDRWLDRDRRGSASVPPSVPSSASGSKNSSFIGTPRLLSRRGSTREGRSIAGHAAAELKGKGREDVQSEGGSPEEEVIETAELRLDRDPGTGRKMINQYLVLHEIGHGTHGRVRLGRDMSVDVPPEELEADLATGSGPFYAIKIVERNPKTKRLAGLGRQRALARSGGASAAKLVAENEIRKEIAIAKKLHHPNVVRMKEIIDDPESSKLYMIFEYCDGGEVEWKAADGGPALTLAQTRQIFRDTLLGLEYLHHQGIIHRDIKPSNLLKSGDKYKISDFGCSHFSEALLSASAVGGEEHYVDDIELAKTAGSPAFFAPEMCYTDIPEEEQQQQPKEVPTLKVRPPSGTDDDRGRPGSFTVLSRDKELTPRPQPQRAISTASIVSTRRPRLPITNAIDVWALGVTLYCLLFGKTPFDAANEYLLMQEIPIAKYKVPARLSRDGLPTDGSNIEANEVLDLLSRLLEKDASKRISVDGAKHHAFSLRGLPDAEAWLASTDPHAESYVTVTNEEVAAAVTRGGSIREKFRRGINSISRRLGFGRHRSQSITDASDINGEHSGGSASGTDTTTATRRVASDNGTIPTQSNLARRLSMLSRDRSRAESPRPGLLASHLERERNTSPSTPVHHEESHLRLPASSEATPRLMPSATSLDKYRSDSFRTDSPTRPSRRQSSDVTADLRPRTGSNASSSAGSVLALGRNIFTRGESMSKRGSQRSVSGLRDRGYTHSSEETDNNVFVGSFASSNGAFPRAPSSEFLRGRSFDELGRRQSTDTLEPSSPSSPSHSAIGHMSPERVAWPSSFRGGSERGGLPGRRGSTLSEDIRPVMEDEEVDWDGGIPDSDDESSDGQDGLPKGHGITSAPADWNLSECIEALERRERLRHSPVRTPARSLLRPSGGIDFSTLRTGSPHRVPPSAYTPLAASVRARSPLTLTEGVATPHQAHTPGTATPAAPATPDAFADAPEDDDGIVIAARGRRGSALSRGNSVRRGIASPAPPLPVPASAVAQRLAS
ncbi:kinase-like protein [Cutaneotrichosporon oleaginosum]|uniref:Kinase-like protein n=1 Tax=Cutaneotrichosporon oleaginosum TaxID=879819 RepID=A0A0J0XKU3_9TREE|nr:kinase-like protein [Cutaneotrichosporon oleaginosum]KLT41721.1 kinase-like protein [Cutaneotrichosporon oleaginosum]TXT08093.1 hypothetical protein COLE_05017 [Cutaneotrichosporon oleaginosum]